MKAHDEIKIQTAFRWFDEMRRGFAKSKDANGATLCGLARSTRSARGCLCEAQLKTSEDVLLLVTDAALALKDDYAKSASSSGNSICLAQGAFNSSRERARGVSSAWRHLAAG